MKEQIEKLKQRGHIKHFIQKHREISPRFKGVDGETHRLQGSIENYH